MNFKMLLKSCFIILGTLSSSTYAADTKSPIPVSIIPKATSIFRGQLRARQFTVLAAGISGKLISFPATHGQRVKKGQKIVIFDCRMEQAEKAIVIAKLKAAEDKLGVNTQLAKYKNISLLEVDLAKAEVAIQKAELNRIKAILAGCSISAPFSGIVSKKMIQAHQYVKQGEPLLELVDTRSLEIEMVLPSRLLKKIPRGTSFSIQLDEIKTPIRAKIDRNVGEIDPVSQTIRVIGKLIKPPKQLLPGMSGKINFAKSK